MRIYLAICYGVVAIAIAVIFDGQVSRAFAGTPELGRWFGFYYWLSFAIGGFWLYYLLAEQIDLSTRNWEWTGRILVFPIVAALWLGVVLVTTYFGATLTEIGRRAFFPYVPIHTHAVEYAATGILGLALAWLPALAVDRLFARLGSSDVR